MKIMRNGVWVEFNPTVEREKRLATEEKRQQNEKSLRGEYQAALERGDSSSATIYRSLAKTCGFQL